VGSFSRRCALSGVLPYRFSTPLIRIKGWRSVHPPGRVEIRKAFGE